MSTETVASREGAAGATASVGEGVLPAVVVAGARVLDGEAAAVASGVAAATAGVRDAVGGGGVATVAVALGGVAFAGGEEVSGWPTSGTYTAGGPCVAVADGSATGGAIVAVAVAIAPAGHTSL
jgi:hypothetical protein